MTPPFVDEHSVTLRAPREKVWPAAKAYGLRLGNLPEGLLGRLLGATPRSGFAVEHVTEGVEVALSGRHRFSTYRLVFAVEDVPDGVRVSATTYADFPGALGRLYRAAVIGSRGHAVAVRRMLASLARTV